MDAVLGEFSHTGFVSLFSIGALGIWKSGMFQGLNCWYLQKALTVESLETIQMSIFRQFGGLVHVTVSCTLWVLQDKLW